MGCMNMNEAFEEILQSDIPSSFERFGKEIDQQWIDDALRETGTASVRKRKIPATLVIWPCFATALFKKWWGTWVYLFQKPKKTIRE